jgi:hypothetical protein
VALKGWPFSSYICNLGDLRFDDFKTLWMALSRGVCKWVALTLEEVAAQKVDNKLCVANNIP